MVMPSPGERWYMDRQEEWLRHAWEQDQQAAWEQAAWERAARATAASRAAAIAAPRRPPPAFTTYQPRPETVGVPAAPAPAERPPAPREPARRSRMAAAVVAIVALVAAAGYPWWYAQDVDRMGNELTSTFPALGSDAWDCADVQSRGRPRADSVSMECDRGSNLVVVTRFRTPALAAAYKRMRAGQLLASARVRPWQVGGTMAGEQFLNGGGTNAQGDRRSLWAGYFYDDARYVVEVVADDQRMIASTVRSLDLPPVADLPS